MNLYFSMKCKFSKQLISMIQKNEAVSNAMKAVCVDDEPYPPNVTHVPTIEHEGKLYVGKQAFERITALNDPKSKDLQGMELGSGFTFIENGTQNFRFEHGISSSDISEKNGSETISSRFDIAKDGEPNKQSSSDLMDKLKAQRENEIPLPMKRV